MDFRVWEVAVEALLAAPEMESEMALEMELVKVLGTALLSQRALLAGLSCGLKERKIWLLWFAPFQIAEI